MLYVHHFEFVFYLRDAFQMTNGFLGHLLLIVGTDRSQQSYATVLRFKSERARSQMRACAYCAFDPGGQTVFSYEHVLSNLHEGCVAQSCIILTLTTLRITRIDNLLGVIEFLCWWCRRILHEQFVFAGRAFEAGALSYTVTTALGKSRSRLLPEGRMPIVSRSRLVAVESECLSLREATPLAGKQDAD